MATTLRVIRPTIVGVGPFGQHVATVLTGRFGEGTRVAGRPGVDTTDDDLSAAFGRPADAVVLALWRPAPALCETADRLAHETGTPWLPVVVEHPHLTVGPWVTPGAGPCFRCFHRRRVQHDVEWAVTRAVHEAYDRDPARGPRGFLPQHARLAAGVAASYLDRAFGGDASPAGRFTTISLRSATPVSHPVLACHGCDRCGTRYQPRDLRRLLRLDVKERVDAH